MQKNQKGNVVIISVIFIAMSLIILIFITAVFMSNINSILYNLKVDMYAINKSAVMSVNKNQANVDRFTYSKAEYKKHFEEALINNYHMDSNLENKDGLISKITIEEYEIYMKGKRDNYTRQKCDDNTIHTIIRVKVRPIILKNVLENIFVFTIHEDVNLNMFQT